MSLAALLIPLIPGLVHEVTRIIAAIRDHPDTPPEAKAQLEGISSQLDDVAAKVAAVSV